MVRKIKKSILTFFILMSLSITVFAHSGNTDIYGGHNDYNNISGLGYYHFHHGFEAHLHNEDGSCPLSAGTNDNSYNNEDNELSKMFEELRRSRELQDERDKTEGYQHGVMDGYNENPKNPRRVTTIYLKYYNQGYDEAHSEVVKKKNTEKFEFSYQEGYNDGLKNDDSYLPYKDGTLRSKYQEGFEDGKKKYELLRKEKIVNTMYTTLGISILVIIAVFIVKKLRKREVK